MKKIIIIGSIVAASFGLVVFSAMASRGDLEYYGSSQKEVFNQNWQVTDKLGNASGMGFRTSQISDSAGSLLFGSNSNLYLLSEPGKDRNVGLNCDIFQGLMRCDTLITKSGIETPFQLQLNTCKSGILHYWTFDYPDFIDSIGGTTYNQNNDQDWVTAGRVRGAEHFDGNNPLVLSTIDNQNIEIGNNGTIEFWLKLDSIQQEKAILSYANSNDFIYLYLDSESRLKVKHYLTGDIFEGSYLKDTDWHHFSITWDDKKIYQYKDGILMTSSNHQGLPQIGKFVVSGDPYVYDNYVNNGVSALFDELAIYNKTLNDTVIEEQYNLSKKGQNYCRSEMGATVLQDTTEGLVGYWGLEEGYGDRVYDAVGDHPGIVQRKSSWVDVGAGKSLFFNGDSEEEGSRSRIKIEENALDFNIDGEITVAAWIYPTKPPIGEGRVVASSYRWYGFCNDPCDSPSETYIEGQRGDGDPSGGTCDPDPCINDSGWYLGDIFGPEGATDGNHFYFSVRGKNAKYPGGKPFGVGDNDFFTDNLFQWNYVVGVLKPGEYMKLFVNGQMYANYTDVPDEILYAKEGNPIYIGARQNDTQGFFHGMIDNVAVYNRALSDVEIQSQYDNALNMLKYKSDFSSSNDLKIIGRWQFEETTDCLAKDSGDNQYDFSLFDAPGSTGCGPAIVTDGVFGHAYEFDGNEYAQFNGGLLNNEETVSFWIKPYDDPPKDYGYVVSHWKIDLSGGRNYYNGFRFYYQKSTQKIFLNLPFGNYYDHEPSLVKNFSASTSENNWHHVAASWSVANNRVRFYVDGVMQEQTDFTGFIRQPIDLMIGNNNIVGDPGSSYVDDFFRGAVDDLHLYDRELNSDEISMLGNTPDYYIKAGALEFTEETGSSAKGPVAHWGFEEGQGYVAFDSIALVPAIAIIDETEGYEDTGMEWVSNGVLGNGIKLDGRDYLEVSLPEYNLGDHGSISFWVWQSPEDAAYNVNKGFIGFGYDGYIYSGSEDRFAFYAGGPNYTKYYGNIKNQDNLGNWQNMVVSWEGTNYRMYLDGDFKRAFTLEAGDFPTTTKMPIGSNSLRIGTYPYFGANTLEAAHNKALKGIFDEVSLYDRTLSDEEIRDNYLEIIKKHESTSSFKNTYQFMSVAEEEVLSSSSGVAGVVGYWRMNNNALDYSGLNNNGIAKNLFESSNPATEVSGSYAVFSTADSSDSNFALDYFKVDNSPSLNVQNNISVEAWVKPDNNQAVVRNDTGQRYVGFWGDGPDDGVAKWFPLNLIREIDDEQIYLWMNIQAVECYDLGDNITYGAVYIENDEKVNIDICSLFGLNYGDSEKISDYQWVGIPLDKSWLLEDKINSENNPGQDNLIKVAFVDRSDYKYSNFKMGATNEPYNTDGLSAAYCSNCTYGTSYINFASENHKQLRPGDFYKLSGSNVIPDDPFNPMMFLSGASVLNKGNSYGIAVAGDNSIITYIGSKDLFGNIYARGIERVFDSFGSQWNHLLLTYSDDYLKTYLNGQELGNPFQLSLSSYRKYYDMRTLIDTDSSPLEIGRGFKGKVDEVIIFNRKLLDDEIYDRAVNYSLLYDPVNNLNMEALNGNLYLQSDQGVFVSGPIYINQQSNSCNVDNYGNNVDICLKASNILMYRNQENPGIDITFTDPYSANFQGDVNMLSNTPINGRLKLIIPTE